MGLRTNVAVLESSVVGASDAVAEALALTPGAPVYKSVRVRSTQAGPLSYITTHVPKDIADEAGGFEIELLGKRHKARLQSGPLFDPGADLMRG